MRYKEIISEEGLVVPGVNMPSYMHKDEIKRQAAKMGFDVDKNGVPPVWTGLNSKTNAKDTVNKAKKGQTFYGKNGKPANKSAPIVESQKQSDIGEVIRLAKTLGFNGFGGLCGEAAIAINRVLFQNKGKLIGMFNAAFLDHDVLFGHVAVYFDNFYWDSDGFSKHEDEASSWGMLDHEDLNYAEKAEELGINWTEEAAENVDIIDLTETEILNNFGNQHLNNMIDILTKAKNKLNY